MSAQLPAVAVALADILMGADEQLQAEAALAKASWPDAALFIRDEDAAAVAVAAEIGATVETEVGGKRDATAGRPVAVRGTVRLLFDGRFVSLERRTPVNMGRTAVVRCGETDLVLTEHPTSQTSPQYFRAVGIEPRERRVLVVQSAHLFRHAFEAEHTPEMVIEVDTPGITIPNATSFVYHRVRRPIFPLDAMWDGGS